MTKSAIHLKLILLASLILLAAVPALGQDQLPQMQYEGFVDADYVRDWRLSVPKTPVNESDPGVFVFPRLRFKTLSFTLTLWDAGPAGDENLMAYMRLHTDLKISCKNWNERNVGIDEFDKIYKLPFLFMSGEGDFNLTPEESTVYGEFFKRGGFLYADDCVMEPNGNFFYRAFIREIQKVLPGLSMRPVPPTHEIYHCFFDIPGGRSPIVQGDRNSPDMGLFYKERLVAFLTAGDVHCGWWAGPPNTYFRANHEACLKMGTNIVIYALSH